MIERRCHAEVLESYEREINRQCKTVGKPASDEAMLNAQPRAAGKGIAIKFIAACGSATLAAQAPSPRSLLAGLIFGSLYPRQRT